MTRLAYVCADPGVPVFGRKGCSIHVREVLRELLALGVQVHLFARRLGGKPPAELDDVAVSSLPALPDGDSALRERAALGSNAALRVELERTGPFDLLYERYSLWSFAGLEYARDVGIPGLLEVNAPLIEEQSRYRELIDADAAHHASERAFGAASGLLAVSTGLAGYLAKQGVSTQRVHVVPNGVDPARFGASVPATLPAESGVFTVGFIGGLRPWHGLSVLAEAFGQLHRRDPATRLLVVGDGPARAELEADLAARGLTAAAELTGLVGPDEIPGLLASMDTAVAPYPDLPDFYFSPLKIYEYMAAGLPVVASRIGQLDELIADELDGLLCAPGDAMELAAALERLRGAPALRQRLGHAARRKVGRDHTWASVARRILAIAGREPLKTAAAPPEANA